MRWQKKKKKPFPNPTKLFEPIGHMCVNMRLHSYACACSHIIQKQNMLHAGQDLVKTETYFKRASKLHVIAHSSQNKICPLAWRNIPIRCLVIVWVTVLLSIHPLGLLITNSASIHWQSLVSKRSVCSGTENIGLSNIQWSFELLLWPWPEQSNLSPKENEDVPSNEVSLYKGQ